MSFSLGRGVGKILALLGMVLMLAILAFSGAEIWRQREQAIETGRRNLEVLSASMAQQTERAFSSVALVLNATLAEFPERWQDISEVSYHHHLKAYMEGVPQITGLTVIDHHGQLRATARAHILPKVDLRERDYFRFHRDNDSPQVYVGKPVASPIDGMVIIPVTRRINGSDGSFQGVVLAALNPAYFQNFYLGVLPPEGGAYALFRDDGMLMARAPYSIGELGRTYDDLPFLNKEAQIGIHDLHSPLDGEHRLAAFQHLPSFDLYSQVSLIEDRLLEPWRDNAMRIAVIALAASCVLAVASFGFIRLVRREAAQSQLLESSQARLRQAQYALDHAADMVFWLGKDGTILYANLQAILNLGYEHGELLGTKYGAIDLALHGAGWDHLLAEMNKAPLYRFESQFHPPNGPSFPVEVSIAALSYDGQDAYLATARNISDRRAHEAILAEKTQRLEDSNAELEQFAYVASHDLREPLRMVNSFLGLLSKRYSATLGQEGLEFLSFAQDGAVRMDRLILDLLEYSRVGRVDRPMTRVDLNNPLSLAVTSLAPMIAETKAEITVDDNLPEVYGAAEEITRLFQNLIGNALKYRHPDRVPHIRFTALNRGKMVLCRVRDNGIGIQPQYYDRIFRIFQRLHSRDAYDGTGIGLAICKKVVERHGGKIWVESTPDMGTSILFTLPVMPDPALDAVRPLRSANLTD